MKKKLRIAILVKSDKVPYWALNMIQMINNSNYGSCLLGIKILHYKENRKLPFWIKCYYTFEKKILNIKASSFRKISIKKVFRTIELIDFFYTIINMEFSTLPQIYRLN